MKRVEKLLRLLANDESGQDLIEYALIAALIGFGCVAGMGTLSNSINTAFSTIGQKVTNQIT